MKTWAPIILILMTIASGLVMSCQSIPQGWRVGIRSTLDAAAACIEQDDPSATRDRRVRACAAAMLDEAADSISTDPPAAPKTQTAPAVDPPAEPEPATVPGSTAWRAPHERRRTRVRRRERWFKTTGRPAWAIAPDCPPAKGWPYRYRRV